jgi:polysaccharide pyruvyl transferase CsaB
MAARSAEGRLVSYRLLVCGFYGSGNCGDEAILAGLIAGLRQLAPEAKIVVLSAQPEETARTHCVAALARCHLGRIWRELGRADLLLSGGGSLFQDATSWRSPLYYLGVIWLAGMRRRPWMMLAQGFGPLRRRALRGLVGLTLGSAAAITVRDGRAAEEVRRLAGRGPKARPVRVAADPSFLLEPAAEARVREIWESESLPGRGRVRIGVSLRAPVGGGEVSAFAERVAAGLGLASRELGASLVFLPFQFPGDLDLSLSVATQVEGECGVVSRGYRAEEVLGLVGECDLLVGMRLHSLMFAAARGVPLVGVCYDPKVEAFVESLGVGSAVGLEARPEELAGAILKAHEEREAVRAGLEERGEALRESAREGLRIALEVMTRKRASRREG